MINEVIDSDRRRTENKFRLLASKEKNRWQGHLKYDATCFGYYYFKDGKGKRFKCRPYQDMILNDPYKRIVVCISRQMGKSTMAAIKAFHKAFFNPGCLVVVVSATKPQAVELIRKLKELMHNANYTDFSEYFPSKKESKSEIELKLGALGSRIISVPATDAGRGYAADLVIVDEAAFIENGDYIFHQVVEPMTQATKGSILLLSTPNGKQGFFHECFKSKYWHSYQFGWWINPENTQKEMDIKKSTMTSLAFQSEYEARFTSSKSAYFNPSEVDGSVSALAGCGASFEPESLLAIGVDFGKIYDNCVITIGKIINPSDEPSKHIVRVLEKRVKPLGTNYASIIGELRALGRNLKPRVIVLDATGVGEGPSDILIQETGMNVEPIKFSIQSKVDIFSNLKVLFEQRRIQIPDDTEMLNQLYIFTYEYTLSGNQKLHAPEGEHDDECDALALMAWGLTRALSPPVSIKLL